MATKKKAAKVINPKGENKPVKPKLMSAKEARDKSKKHVPLMQEFYLQCVFLQHVNEAAEKGLTTCIVRVGDKKDGLDRTLLINRLKRLGYKCEVTENTQSGTVLKISW